VKLRDLHENDKAARIADAKAWLDMKENILYMVSDLRSHNMEAACFNDVVKTKDDLQVFFFDKVFPHLKEAGFPKPHSTELAAMWKAFRKEFFGV